MKINESKFSVKGTNYIIRSANFSDACELSKVRLLIDGETEYMDRERGEAYIDEFGFQKIIENDTKSKKNIFLVAVINEKIVGFSRCEGNNLKRFSHKAEFGVCVLKDYWGYKIGKNLLLETIKWADSNEVKKITLNVLESNEKAFELYKKYGFEIEGIFKKDKVLSDGKYHNTIAMARFNE